ncbi:outer membrane beta-barrel protein [Pontibacter sp. JAM-7]|uniref:outer membrane beta-barrel protein n=1 Tax=Pontibacter sp. JAM-7 TaxID=3366581 RepID=UPI003AF46B5D
MHSKMMALAAAVLSVQAGVVNALDVGVILDAYHKSETTALGGRSEGFGSSHSELSLSQDVADFATAQVSLVGEWNEDESDLVVEEAYLQTTALPGGLNVMGGRFLADIGYLNATHNHADNFSERPLLYRAFLGGHYFDDGVGVSWLVPTARYWRLSAGAFSGDELGEADSASNIGTWTLSTELGDDIGETASWQMGFSYLRNNTQSSLHHHEDDHDEEHDHEHVGHAHGAAYQGKNLYLADLVWKWAPQGNNRQQQIKIAAEYAYVDDIYTAELGHYDGWYLSGIYQFDENWATGIRYGRVNLAEEHEHEGEHEWQQGRLTETTVMLSWQPTHSQRLRLEYRHQDAAHMEGADNAITLNYQIGFGAHAAHSF